MEQPRKWQNRGVVVVVGGGGGGGLARARLGG